MLLGTPWPEAGCDRKLWQEAGMSSYTHCTVSSSSAQLSPGCTSVQVLRNHLMNGHSSLEPSTSCKSPWKSQGSPTELCPTTAELAGGTLGIKTHPWEPLFLCALPTLGGVDLTTPPHLWKRALHKWGKDGKFIRHCRDHNCRATLKYKHNLELQHKQNLSRGLEFFAESIHQHHYLYI